MHSQPIEHGLRRALLAVWLGEELGLGAVDLSDAYYVALLGSVGCTIEQTLFAKYKDDVIVCWQGPLESEWIAVAAGVAVAHFGRPPDLGPPGAPGPFALADGDRLRPVIEAGGFGDVTLEAITRSIRMGDDIDVVELIASLDQTKALFEGQPADKVAAAVDALRHGFSPYARPDGVVMNGSAWLATAHR